VEGLNEDDLPKDVADKTRELASIRADIDSRVRFVGGVDGGDTDELSNAEVLLLLLKVLLLLLLLLLAVLLLLLLSPELLKLLLPPFPFAPLSSLLALFTWSDTGISTLSDKGVGSGIKMGLFDDTAERI